MNGGSQDPGEAQQPVEGTRKRGPNYKLLWPLALGMLSGTQRDAHPAHIHGCKATCSCAHEFESSITSTEQEPSPSLFLAICRVVTSSYHRMHQIFGLDLNNCCLPYSASLPGHRHSFQVCVPTRTTPKQPPANFDSTVNPGTHKKSLSTATKQMTWMMEAILGCACMHACRKQPVLRTRLLFGTAAAVLVGAHHSGMTRGIGSK